MSAVLEFSCLYTAQKLKKRKTWTDGLIRLNEKSRCLRLLKKHPDTGRLLGEVEVRGVAPRLLRN